MRDPAKFGLTAALAHGGLAVKGRRLELDGQVTKFDYTLNEKLWRFWWVECDNDVDEIVQLLRRLNTRPDFATLHGAPAPGIRSSQWHPRWSSEGRGDTRTLVDVDRSSIPFDCDKFPLPPNSTLGDGQNIFAQAEYVREDILPRAFRNAELVVRASSSTGFSRERGSLHCYAMVDPPVPLPTSHRWLKGLQASGGPFDPRVALPGQLFLSARPRLVGITDPVPEHLRVFVLRGSQRYVRGIDWDEFEPQLAAREATERRAHHIGAGQGWRAVLENFLGDGEGKLGFFEPLTMASGHAARSGEPVDEVAGAMRAIVVAHPDCNTDRAAQYTSAWLRRGLMSMQRKDAARDAQIAGFRERFLPDRV